LNFFWTTSVRPTSMKISWIELSYVMTDVPSASLSWNKAPIGAYDETFITVRQLKVCWFGALSLTRARVCRLQFLLVLVSAVILGSESFGTREHILLSHIWDFPFRRLFIWQIAKSVVVFNLPQTIMCTVAFMFISYFVSSSYIFYLALLSFTSYCDMTPESQNSPLLDNTRLYGDADSWKPTWYGTRFPCQRN
jgi:hypothetical protein